MTFFLRGMLAVLLCFLLFCSLSSVSGGSGSDVETKTVALSAHVSYEGGVPAGNAMVIIRPMSYLSDTAMLGGNKNLSAKKDTTTTESGNFLLKSCDTGVFFLELHDTGHFACMLVCTVKVGNGGTLDLGELYLKPTSFLRGKIDLTDVRGSATIYARIYGLERAQRVAPDGSFLFSDIPAGQYVLLFCASAPSLGVTQSEPITVGPGMDINCGAFAFPLSYWRDTLIVRRLLDTNGLQRVPVSSVATMNNAGRIAGLDLRNSGISIIPSDIGMLRLRSLRLPDNHIRSLPNELTAMITLTTIDLTNNNLAALPDSFGNLIGLDTLMLERNQLTSLPMSIIGLKNITLMDIDENELDSFGLPSSLVAWIDAYAINKNWADTQTNMNE